MFEVRGERLLAFVTLRVIRIFPAQTFASCSLQPHWRYVTLSAGGPPRLPLLRAGCWFSPSCAEWRCSSIEPGSLFRTGCFCSALSASLLPCPPRTATERIWRPLRQLSHGVSRTIQFQRRTCRSAADCAWHLPYAFTVQRTVAQRAKANHLMPSVSRPIRRTTEERPFFSLGSNVSDRVDDSQW